MSNRDLRNYAVFPHNRGADYFWAARRIFKGGLKWRFPRKGMTKFSKTQVVWGLERIINAREKTIWITEGIFDAIATSGVAIFGKHPSPIQIQQILKTYPEEIVIAFDVDAKLQAERIQRRLRGLVKTTIRLPEKYSDYGEYLKCGLRRKFGESEFREAR